MTCKNVVFAEEDLGTSNVIFTELIHKQLRDVEESRRMTQSDLQRVAKHVEVGLFQKSGCCMWKGYVTNVNKRNKGTYINFYFRQKKVPLHRLLYQNFVGPLDFDDYIRFRCSNKGFCCNTLCLERRKYKNRDKAELSQHHFVSCLSSERNMHVFFI